MNGEYSSVRNPKEKIRALFRVRIFLCYIVPARPVSGILESHASSVGIIRNREVWE